MKIIKIFDVAIRESVYLKRGMTEEKALVYLKEYVKLMPFAEVQGVELCFLDNDKPGTLLYNEQFINDAYEIVKGKYGLTAVLHPNFVDLSRWNPEVVRKFEVVRFMIQNPINAHAEELIDYLHNLGVKVSINVIYISRKEESFVDECVAIAKKHKVEQFALADSCGGIVPSSALKWIQHLKSVGGAMERNFHFHDHFNLALANALTCFDYVNILDCSVYGLGKGGGNLNLENLVFATRKINGLPIIQEEIIKYAHLLQFLMKDILEEGWEKALEDYKNLLVGFYNCNLKDIARIEEQVGADVFKFCELVSA